MHAQEMLALSALTATVNSLPFLACHSAVFIAGIHINCVKPKRSQIQYFIKKSVCIEAISNLLVKPPQRDILPRPQRCSFAVNCRRPLLVEQITCIVCLINGHGGEVSSVLVNDKVSLGELACHIRLLFLKDHHVSQVNRNPLCIIDIVTPGVWSVSCTNNF